MGGRIRHLIRRGRAKIRRALKRLRNRLFMFKRISHKEIGDSNDRAYELWTSDTETGTVSMTVKRDGRYKCKWVNVQNVLFRTGYRFGGFGSHEMIGEICLDYSAQYEPVGDSYMSVYGWTEDPIVEFYIVESWGTCRPEKGTYRKTIISDGEEYDIYERARYASPSIRGNSDFIQYWSVRKTKRTEGYINVSAHFRAWEDAGMPMGRLYEISLSVEGCAGSSGKAAVMMNNLMWLQ